MKYLLGNINGRDGTDIPVEGPYGSLEELQEAYPEGAEGHFLVEGSVYIFDSEWKDTGLTLDAFDDATLTTPDADEPSASASVTRESGLVKVDFTLSGIKPEFRGASSGADGKAGLVPAPLAGDTSSVLFGSGDWVNVSFTGGSKADIESMSWAEIGQLAGKVEAAPLDYGYLIGTEKEFEVVGHGRFHAQIVDLCHFEKADGSGKAGLTFRFKEATTPNYQMNTVNTNVGGYVETNMGKYTLPMTLFDKLPEDLRNVIVEVKIPYNVYKQSGSGNSAFDIKETTAKLFPPSSREEYGSKSYEVGADGEQMAYWTLHTTYQEHTRYRNGTTLSADVWTRSSDAAAGTFIVVNPNNGQGHTGAHSTTVPVAPYFCIGGD